MLKCSRYFWGEPLLDTALNETIVLEELECSVSYQRGVNF